MTNVFQPRLLNGIFGDPGIFVRLRWERRALLVDAGDLTGQAPADLLKVTDIFVSHAHIDHFIGFDHLLRIVLVEHNHGIDAAECGQHLGALVLGRDGPRGAFDRPHRSI